MSNHSFPLIIPFHRNPMLHHEKHWIGRIRELLARKGHAMIGQSGALNAQGGVGKTAMAVEYAYRFAGKYPGGVFWLQMNQGLGPATRRLFEFAEESGVDLGGWKGIQGPDLIRKAMSFFNQRPLKLIVLDNLEGDTLPEELLGLKDVQLLVTTWQQGLGLPMIEMVLPEMGEALDIFLGYSGRKPGDLTREEHEAAARICRRADRLPLALEIMGRLAGRRPMGSLAQDLTRELRRIKPPADGKELTSTFAALRLAGQALEHPRATEGLIAAGYLNPEALGEDILAGVLGVDEVEAGEILTALAELSVLVAGKQAYTIHGLVQEAARLMDVDQGVGEKVAGYLDNRVEEALSHGPYREAYPIIPHLFHLGSLAGSMWSEDRDPDVSPISRWATFLWRCGFYPQAETLYSLCLRRFERTKGKEHPRYSFYLNNLAGLLRYQGKYKEAERLYREALNIHEKTAGKEHPDYATGLANLAGVLLDQGSYNQAEWLYREALDIDEETIGKEHPDYVIRLNNLGVVLRYQGRDKEAEELLRQALDLGEKAIGEEHPSYATGLANLAAVLRDQGRYEAAAGLLRQALDIGEKTVGKEHPSYAVHLNELAMLLRFQGEVEAAEGLLRQALDIDATTIGMEHPSSALHLNNLAVVLVDQGKDEEADGILQQM